MLICRWPSLVKSKCFFLHPPGRVCSVLSYLLHTLKRAMMRRLIVLGAAGTWVVGWKWSEQQLSSRLKSFSQPATPTDTSWWGGWCEDAMHYRPQWILDGWIHHQRSLLLMEFGELNSREGWKGKWCKVPVVGVCLCVTQMEINRPKGRWREFQRWTSELGTESERDSFRFDEKFYLKRWIWEESKIILIIIILVIYCTLFESILGIFLESRFPSISHSHFH